MFLRWIAFMAFGSMYNLVAMDCQAIQNKWQVRRNEMLAMRNQKIPDYKKMKASLGDFYTKEKVLIWILQKEANQLVEHTLVKKVFFQTNNPLLTYNLSKEIIHLELDLFDFLFLFEQRKYLFNIQETEKFFCKPLNDVQIANVSLHCNGISYCELTNEKKIHMARAGAFLKGYLLEHELRSHDLFFYVNKGRYELICRTFSKKEFVFERSLMLSDDFAIKTQENPDKAE